MYRTLISGLAALSTLALLGMVGIILWQDYQWHGNLAMGRAFGSAGARFAEIPGLTVGLFSADPATPPDTPTATPLAADATAAAQPTPPPIPTITPEELLQSRQFMLGLINADRARFGLPPVTLGDNPAAQEHAGDMMRHNYRSHWGTDGLAPYMRYTRAGGFNRELQNIAGPDRLTGTLNPRSGSLVELLEQAQDELMSSPEHQANILDPWHRKVNLGIACNEFACWVVQQFEGDQVWFSDRPAIVGGKLTFAGELEDGLEFDGVAVWYHRLPQPLTLGQLDATYSYGSGQYPATFLRPALTDNRYYPDSVSNYGWKSGIDPYTLDPGLARIDAPPLRVDVTQRYSVPWTTASLWGVAGPIFHIQADLTPIIEDAGPGVYTVQIWAKAGAERVAVTNYSIFVE